MLRSLTFKILLAVGVTVAAVIGIYTYFVIKVQTTWWYERAQAQNVVATSLVKDHLDRVMLSGRDDQVESFLRQLTRSEDILYGRIIRPDGLIAYSTVSNEAKRATFTTPEGLFRGDDVLHGMREENGHRVAIAMAPIQNQSVCHQCHDAKQNALGAVVLTKSLAPAEASIAGNRNLIIAFGAVLLGLVGLVLWLLVVRLVRQPVSELLAQMRRVQQGDLHAHASMNGSDEIGELSNGFNAMVESLESTRRELHESHQRQIQQADKLASIGELAAGIAHEIRNPLAGIGAAVEVLAENNNGSGQYAEVAGEIHQQIARLNRTIHNLLDFARPRTIEVAPCNVEELIQPMLNLVRPDAQKHRVRIVEMYGADLPPISADAQQVQQAILNIVLNGVQAMPNGGTVTVRAESRTGVPSVHSGSSHAPEGRQDAGPACVRISITDTGAGISPENRGKIFSPFFTTKHRGTGLGLSITRNIVEKHGGHIEVESEPGRGTTFHLEFAAAELAMPKPASGRTSPARSESEVWSYA